MFTIAHKSRSSELLQSARCGSFETARAYLCQLRESDCVTYVSVYDAQWRSYPVEMTFDADGRSSNHNSARWLALFMRFFSSSS